jgi:aminobenzoyl-glutamate utilization protein B
MPILDGIWSRIVKCAEAGALATETRMQMELVGSVYNELPNEPLAKIVDKHLRSLGGVKYSPEEKTFAEKLRETFTLEGALPLGSQEEIQQMDSGSTPGSTDVSDVSWIVPTTEFRAATYVPGTPDHSWQAVACTGYSIGRKGMIVAAKTLTLSAIDLLRDPKLIEAAKTDFNKRRAGVESFAHPCQSKTATQLPRQIDESRNSSDRATA